MGLDIQLLSRWFHKGYSSREMATFLLIAETTTESPFLSANQVEQRWAEIHDEVVQLIYKK